MRLVVLADEGLKEELLAQGTGENVQVEWVSAPGSLVHQPDADGYIDLLYNEEENRSNYLEKLLPKPVIVNAVISTGLPTDFIRINGWKTFLKRPVVEASCHNKLLQPEAEKIFSAFNKKTAWTPDIPGFISARVVAMIINEAYFSLAEEVSTKEEIDTAMKLGTNYPYGPFEWGEKIGLKNILALLYELSKEQQRYNPAPLLKKEALL